jgi:hypothetical protein
MRASILNKSEKLSAHIWSHQCDSSAKGHNKSIAAAAIVIAVAHRPSGAAPTSTWRTISPASSSL